MMFNRADSDRKGYLEENEAKNLLAVVLNKFDEVYGGLELAEQSSAIDRLFEWMDTEKVSKISFREFKATIIRAYNKKLPLGILEPISVEEEVAA